MIAEYGWAAVGPEICGIWIAEAVDVEFNLAIIVKDREGDREEYESL